MHFFVWLNQTEHVHTSAYTSLCSICKCKHLYISECTCACLHVKLWACMWNLIRRSICWPEGRTPLRHLSLRSALLWLRCENQPQLLSALSHSRTSSQSRHPALTFPRAENRRGIPADVLLEMLKTAKLGSVTGNLQGLVLADISDSLLSTLYLL